MRDLNLPAPPDQAAALELIITVVDAEETKAGIEAVRLALQHSPAEAYDEQGNNAIKLAVEAASKSGERGPESWGARLLGHVLAGGAPADARSADGRTALITAAYSGRVDLCRVLIEAGSSVLATDV